MTTLLIQIKNTHGAEQTLHIVVDPEFIPDTGDFVVHENLRYVVVERGFHYAATLLTENQSHVVTLLVKARK